MGFLRLVTNLILKGDIYIAIYLFDNLFANRCGFPMLFKFWASVYNAGRTFKRYWKTISV